MIKEKTLAQKHSFFNEIIFNFKVNGLIFLQSIKNIVSPKKHFTIAPIDAEYQVVSVSESLLWNENDTIENKILTAGKIQNLRISAQKINGLKIPAHEIFSFWQHIGHPSKSKGYVVGREIREGCIMPSVAGGLCQLSNAIYDAALKANLKIVERHQHSQIVKGSLAEKNRDATVKWNYLDLKFTTNVPIQLSVEFDAEFLRVSIWARNFVEVKENLSEVNKSSVINDCYSCGNVVCYHHPAKKENTLPHKTIVLYGDNSLFNSYLGDFHSDATQLILIDSQNKNKVLLPNAKTIELNTETFFRKLKRKILKPKQNIFSAQLHRFEAASKMVFKHIDLSTTDLIVQQDLAPFLFHLNAFAGRNVEVLQTRLPFNTLQERLDQVLAIYPESLTLNDFRLTEFWLQKDSQTLENAQALVTPHLNLYALFPLKTKLINWTFPPDKKVENNGDFVLFPASALARKGAYELRNLVIKHGLKIKIVGKAKESDDFWNGIETHEFLGNWQEIKLVLYPVYIEHNPKFLLEAISKGIPIVTTKYAGIPPQEKVYIFENPTELMANFLEVFRQIMPENMAIL